MKNLTQYAVGLATALLLLSGCSSVNRLIKSGQPDEIYAKGVEFYEAGKWQKAISLFESAAPYFSGTTRADTVAFYVARCYYKNRDYAAAVDMLDQFRRTFGRSPFVEEAEGMHALCFYHMSPGPERDQSMTAQAIVTIEEFLSHYPDSDRGEEFRAITQELQQKLHDQAFLNAYTYYKIGRYKSAVTALRNALKLYPDSSHREELMYLIVASSYELAHNSIERLQTDRYLSMLDHYYTYIDEYRESPRRKQLDRYAKEAKDYLAKNTKEENNNTQNGD